MKLTAASAAQPPGQMDRDHAAPYKLVVLAPGTTDAVSAAGGIIVDALRIGWRVEAYLETESDARALQILGLDGHVLPARFDFEAHWPDAVIFAASMYDRHRGVRRFLTDAARRHGANVAAWGGSWSAAPGSAADINHRLSSAARAFKHHAMKAAGAAGPAGPVETFHGGFHRLTTVPG